MSVFDDKKNAHEAKFVHDAAKEFKAEARRNKALGHWAAELLGIAEDEREKYAMSVIAADMEEAGDDDVFRKLQKDFDEGNVDMTDAAIREKMQECLEAARAEVYGSD